VGPVEDSTRQAGVREAGPVAKPGRRPRTRRCLLKGCEQRFRPRSARQRYCSDKCRQSARQWSRWKAQQSYRATKAGKDRRNQQSRRYRERVKSRKQAASEQVVQEPARVITKDFFRPLLRPAWLLRRIRSAGAIAQAALLFARMPARHGASLAARTALASHSPTAAEDLSQAAGR
jgi:hypothetical protein